jgi:hypothetical protein
MYGARDTNKDNRYSSIYPSLSTSRRELPFISPLLQLEDCSTRGVAISATKHTMVAASSRWH